MVYLALCQSILGYCIPAWGAAAKTFMITLERAQRAILKVMHSKRFRFPTTELYSLSNVLTVRQLFIIRTILRKHPDVPALRDPNKRSLRNICATGPHRTTFATRHYSIISCIIYNNVAKSIDNLPVFNKYLVKQKVTEYLVKLNYKETEALLFSNYKL